MPSEYDFLVPYSRSLRRIGRAVLLTSAIVVGIACTAFVVALPLRWDGSERVATSSEKPDQSWKGQKTADAATKPKAAEAAPPRPSAEMKPTKPPARTANSSPAPRPPTHGMAAPSAPEQMTESTVLGFGRPRDTNRDTNGAARSPSSAVGAALPSSAAPALPADNSHSPTPAAAPTDVAATEPVPEPRPRPREADAAAPSAIAANEEASKQASAPTPTHPVGELKLVGDAPQAGRVIDNNTDGSASEPASSRPTTPVHPSSSAKEAAPAERAVTREKTAARPAEPARGEPEKPAATQSRPRSTEAPTPRQERVSTPRESVAQENNAEKPAAKVRERSRVTQDSRRKERRQATREEPRQRVVRREEPWRDQRRFARDRDDGRDVRREFVDEDGVRHIVLPRREKRRLLEDLGERTASRQGPFLFMRGPRGLFDDDDED